jgi:hypothetical protein
MWIRRFPETENIKPNHMRRYFILLPILALLFSACGSSKKSSTGSGQAAGIPKTANGPSETFSKSQASLMDDNTFQLDAVSDDETYGYTQANPVCVGGVKKSEGPLNERRFLNALLGANGEELEYTRRGSCCPFSTPNGMIGNSGMLDIYVVKYKGQAQEKAVSIFINMYDFGKLKAPKGFTFKK